MKTGYIEKWMQEFNRGIPELNLRIEIRNDEYMKYHAYIISYYESSKDEGNEITTLQMECIGETVNEAMTMLETECMNDFARLHEITERLIDIANKLGDK